MIRLLIIGRDAEKWRQNLGHWEDRSIEIETEALPAAGVRNFSETTPDAVGIAEPDRSPRIEPIATAIRERPLGRIVPILTFGTPYRGEADLDLAGSVGADQGAEALVGVLEDLLEVSLDPPPESPAGESAESQRRDDLALGGSADPGGGMPDGTELSSPSGDARERAGDERLARELAADQKRVEVEGAVEYPDYTIEPLEEGEEEGVQSGVTADGDGTPAEPEEIRRKLEEVRHENYFEVLNLAPTADGDEVRAAHRRLRRRFEPGRLDAETAGRYEAELDEIRDAFDDARAVLGDDELRAAYRAKTASN